MTEQRDRVAAGAAVAAEPMRCRRCGGPVRRRTGGRADCPSCGWSGWAWCFEPVGTPVGPAQAAGADEPRCVHHPQNKAVAVCAGSGDYICSLCAAPLGRRLYSVQYLDRVGLEALGQEMATVVARPERMVLWMCLASWLTVMFFGVSAFLASGVAVVYYVRMFVERARRPMYRRLVGVGRIVTTSLYLLLTLATAGLWVGLYLLMWLGRE